MSKEYVVSGNDKRIAHMSQRLHKNHPKWPPEKVARKVAEKLKLKVKS